MSDNTGPYVTYDELIYEMFIADSSLVSVSVITLSNKTVNIGGDIFDYTGTGTPLIGDVIEQAGETAIIIAFPAAGKIQINKTGTENLIVSGPVQLLHSNKVSRKRGESLIIEGMRFIDEKTRQFFNKRSGTYFFEGNNTPILHLQVPIIEIDELIINSTDLELFEGEDYDFYAFKGRERPQDDRRNPRIKLNVGRGRDSIFSGAITNRVFCKNTLTKITGSFGFLESDGSTPASIKKATMMLAMKTINSGIGSSSLGSTTGPLKRVKVDLHEKEFFELKEATSSSSVSGIPEVDEIIATYRAPIIVSGSIKKIAGDFDNYGYYEY